MLPPRDHSITFEKLRRSGGTHGEDPTVFADFSQGEDNVSLVDVATGGVTVLKLPDPAGSRPAARAGRLAALTGSRPAPDTSTAMILGELARRPVMPPVRH